MDALSGIVSDAESAYPGLSGISLNACEFRGAAALSDGEEMTLTDCRFFGQMPLLRLRDSLVRGGGFAPVCTDALRRAARVTLQDTVLSCPRGLSGASGVVLDRCSGGAPDLGEGCRDAVVRDSLLEGERLFRSAASLQAENTEFRGARALECLSSSSLDFSTVSGDDALRGAEDVVITDSILEGDRLGWFCEGVTLRGCVISGARPFAHCRRLVLENCRLDPSCTSPFEGSEVSMSPQK